MDQNLNGATVVAAGGMVVEVLIETGASGGPITQADVNAWINTHALHVTTVMATDTQTEILLQGREQAYIIDTNTMQIVWRHTGSQFDQGEALTSSYLGMQQMMQLLP